MDGKERVLDGFEVFGMTRENAETMYGHLVKAVKEEIIPKDQTYQEFFGLDEKPQLIQGYTAEQWKDIIDGGYLCEFDMEGNFYDDYMYTSRLKGRSGTGLFVSTGFNEFKFCRPAQIKGVMRPIFVEPVDKEAWCHFFLGEDRVRYGKCEDVYTAASNTGATKYIEL